MAPSSERPGEVFVNPAPAPERSGVRSVAIFNVTAQGPRREMAGSSGGSGKFAASYLAIELVDGWCIIDEVIGWERRAPFYEAEFQSRWEDNGKGPRLVVSARRSTQGDDERGGSAESGVLLEKSATVTHSVSAGIFKRISYEATYRDSAFTRP